MYSKRKSGSDGKYVRDKRAEDRAMVSQGVVLANRCYYDAVAGVVCGRQPSLTQLVQKRARAHSMKSRLVPKRANARECVLSKGVICEAESQLAERGNCHVKFGPP